MIAHLAAIAQADDTWTGASTAAGNLKFLWSDATNWSPGVPTSPARTLTFPDLGACTGACYTSSNNLGPISAAGLVLSNTTVNTQYKIQGNPVSVGAGGIRDNSGHSTGNLIQVPLVLSTNQSWMVGAGFGHRGYNSLSVTGAVSGAPSNLTVPFVAGSGNGSSGSLFVTADMEVGQVTVTGSGALHIGNPTGGASVNGTNGNPVAISSGATLIANPNSKVGALSVGADGTGGELLLGTGSNNEGAVTLVAENGISPNAVSLDPSSSTQTYINSNGSTPGRDFSQLTAAGPIALGGQLILAQGPSGSACSRLGHDQVATLITTTGPLTGKFANASTNGAIIAMAAVGGSCSAPPLVRINYTANSVIATVLSATTPTTTTLAIPRPSPAAMNQPVTLTATVKANSHRSVAPAGTVRFTSSGTGIPGCTARPVTSTAGSNGTATCTTSFLAAGSPESLRASFTGTAASRRGSSISAPQPLTVTKNTGRLLGPAGRLSVIGRTIVVPVRCQSRVTCVGHFSLITTTRVAKTRKLVTVTCAAKNFRVKAHRTGNVRARHSAACAKLLDAASHHRLTVTFIAQSRAGQVGQRKRITLVRK